MASTKPIPGYLYNIAQQFGVSCSHILYLMDVSARSTFSADLLSGEILPEDLRIARNQNLVAIVQRTLRNNIFPILGDQLLHAELVLTLEPSKKVRIVVRVSASSGKTWQAEWTDERPLFQP